MFSRYNRRRRKASPDPESRFPSDAYETPDHGQRRRRATDTDSPGSADSSLLPTAFRSSSGKKKPPSQLPSFQPGNTCNSFLLGGQFYPGKDKKRKHMRRRTIWYRVFFSSPWRAVISVIVIVYVILWHVLVPFTHLLLDFGRTLAPGKHGFYHVTSLSLPSVEEQRIEALRLKEERNRLQMSDRRYDERMKVLGSIVPKWFHRNDVSKPVKHKAGESDDETEHEQHARKGGSSGGKPRHANERQAEVTEKQPEQGGSRRERIQNATDAADANTTVVQPAQPDKQAEPAAKPLKAAVQNANTTSVTPNATGTINDTPKTVAQNTNATAPTPNATYHEPIDLKQMSQETAPARRTLQNMDSYPATSSCPASLSANDIRITLVIQSSLDRLWILGETCSRWKSPIVLVVHLPHGTEDEPASLVTAKETCPQLSVVPYKSSRQGEEKWAYPVNQLRNAGLDSVQTSHVLVADIDFVPSMDLDALIRSTIVEQQAVVDPSQLEAMVVPAFERLPPQPCSKEHDCGEYLRTNSSFIPKSLDELRSCALQKECSVFQLATNWEGHHSTRSESWIKEDWYEMEPNAPNATDKAPVRRIRTIKCFDSLRYEPYVVLRWCPVSSSDKGEAPPTPVAPYYDERFYGYGKNKIQLISHLRFMGYHFSVLPKGFIVHNPHSESLAKETWNDVQKHDLHQEMDALYPEFLEELWNKYRETTKYIVQQCKRIKKN